MILYVDEAACYLLPFLSRTWAPRGQTPVIEEKSGREHLSLIAALAPNGRLYLSGQDKAFKSEQVVEFLEYLCRRYRKKDLIVIWQGRLCGRGHDSSQPGRQGLSGPEARSGAPGCLTGIQPGAQPGGTPVESIEARAEKSSIPEFEGFGRGSGQ